MFIAVSRFLCFEPACQRRSIFVFRNRPVFRSLYLSPTFFGINFDDDSEGIMWPVEVVVAESTISLSLCLQWTAHICPLVLRTILEL